MPQCLAYSRSLDHASRSGVSLSCRHPSRLPLRSRLPVQLPTLVGGDCTCLFQPLSQDPWEEDENPLDLNDSMDDQVHVPIAFTQATTHWLPEAGHAPFAQGTAVSVSQAQAEASAALAMPHSRKGRLIQRSTPMWKM